MQEDIDAASLADALRSGIHRVLAGQSELNRINVFPVADGDTGTNLALSLGAALESLRPQAAESGVGAMLVAVADRLLDNARGNSGALVAQFFQGLSDAVGERPRLSLQDFAAAAQTASEYARDALAEPREGTILSVMRAFAERVGEFVNDPACLSSRELFAAAVASTEAALARTPEQLEVLKKAGVVDAGAKGFAEMVAGMSHYFDTGKVEPLPADVQAALADEADAIGLDDGDSHYRYCTECLVNGDNIDRRKLRESLSVLGDSLVLAGSKRKAKIHIHCDKPESVFAAASRFGEVSAQKADDMRRQQASRSAPRSSFAVITDSAADLSDADMERFDIHMVPCRIQFGNRGYLDKVSITTDEFYAELESNPIHPTTSQPAPGDFRRQFQFLASHHADVLSINLTSQASGTWQAAVAAAERVRAGGRIHVIDSRNASVGQGQLVVMAAACAAAGVSAERTVKIIAERLSDVQIFAVVEDLRYAVRGGRVSSAAARLCSLFNLRPVLTVGREGGLRIAGVLIGKSRMADKFARFVAARVPTSDEVDVAVGHAVCPQNMAKLSTRLQELMPNIVSLKTCELGTGLGVHGGPGTLVVSAHPLLSVERLADGND